MKIERTLMDSKTTYEELSFKFFPDFFEWIISHRKEVSIFLQKGFEQWKDNYKQCATSKEVAELGAYLTTFLNMVLEFDRSRGVITPDESVRYFIEWRELIYDMVLLYDVPPKMITVSKEFYV